MSPSDYISLTALAVSLFTFYWTSIRYKRSLHLVRVQGLFRDSEAEFVLINGSNMDVLFTSIRCAFGLENEHEYTILSEKVYGPNNLSFILEPGSSYHYKGKFNQPIFLGYFQGQEKEQRTHEHQPLYHSDYFVIVEWLDMNGKEHQVECKLGSFGFDDEGEPVSFAPQGKLYDLYAKR